MKWIRFFSLLAVFFASVIHAQNQVWFNDYQKAVELAREQQKSILLYFTGSDWCGWCMKLKKEVLDSVDFVKEIQSDFICVEVDFPLYKSLASEEVEQNNVLKDQHEINNFPTLVLLDCKQRSIAKIGYLPLSGKNYAKHLVKTINDDKELSLMINDFRPEQWDSMQLEKFYKTALQFKRTKEAELILEAGLKSEDNVYFMAEKYRLFVENGKAKTREGLELRQRLLEIDPLNNRNLQFFIALTDFQIRSSQKNSIESPNQIVEPLKYYLEKFGAKDFDNVWRLEMMMAQFFYDYAENEEALSHAEIAYQKAPETIKPEIRRSIEYIQSHPSF